MKTLLPSAAFAIGLACIASALPACNREPSASTTSQPPEGSAIVWGTVFDLATGEPAADVEVSFEGGKPVRTDATGRFEIRGLALGSAGTVKAVAVDGREGTVVILPLRHERREIVLNIRGR